MVFKCKVNAEEFPRETAQQKKISYRKFGYLVIEVSYKMLRKKRSERRETFSDDQNPATYRCPVGTEFIRQPMTVHTRPQSFQS